MFDGMPLNIMGPSSRAHICIMGSSRTTEPVRNGLEFFHSVTGCRLGEGTCARGGLWLRYVGDILSDPISGDVSIRSFTFSMAILIVLDAWIHGDDCLSVFQELGVSSCR